MEGLERIAHSKSKSFLFFCISFLSGVAFASFLPERFLLIFGWYLGVFVTGIFLIFFWEHKEIRSLLFGAIFLILGVIRFSATLPVIDENHVAFYNGHEFSFDGVIMQEGEVRLDGMRYVVKTEKIAQKEGLVSGKVLIQAPRYPEYQYGDLLRVTCALTTPQKIKDFDYGAYLARFNIFSVCKNPHVEKIATGQGNRIMAGLLSLKNTFQARLNILLPEPHASFLGALLYGARSTIPPDLQDALYRTGTTHIIAISGYNITIIVSVLMILATYVYIPRKKAFWGIVVGICLFVLFAGASASVVRAGVMGIAMLVASQIGRIGRTGNILVLTALVMVFLNPRILLFDVGFQLSFLATMGLTYVSPILEKWFKNFPLFFGITETLITTLSAILVTTPLILYQFGRLSTVAPFTNILILWTIPLVMLLGFVGILLSFIWIPIGQVVLWIGWFFIEYILSVVHAFAGLPWSSVTVSIPWYILVLGYMVLFVWVYRTRVDRIHTV